MNKFYLGTLLLLTAFSYSQNKIAKGSYVSTTQGQDIKLNLKENNQYELVVFYGDYEIKNDTLQLKNNHTEGNDFAVAFLSDANPGLGKVKVKLIGNSVYYYGIYLGTQSGSAAPSFKTISELIGDAEFDKTESEFEINRSDFFYLVKEDYNGESALNKFALPKSANEIQIQYTPNYLGSVELQGFLNEKNELVVAEKSKRNPLIFVEESKKPKALESQEKPIETIKKKNWTYAGKDISNQEYFGAVDSSATAATSYKLHIQDNLQKAMEVAKKTPAKFLVVSYDPDNKNGKSEFNEFIKNQQYNIGTYSSYDNTAEFDKYNYYAATSKDKSWASKNKISDNPSTIVLDSEGTILSQTKGNAASNASLFEVYSNTSENLKQTEALIKLNKVLNSKAKESEIVKKLLPLSDYNAAGWTIYPPLSQPSKESDPVEVTTDFVAVDTVSAAYPDYFNYNETVYTKINFDKKKILSTWENIVKSHLKDAKPDMDFVQVTLAEIQNRGFYNKIFNEERVYDETNFKAIDYLIKHYDAILAEQSAKSADSVVVAYDTYYGSTIETLLSNAISSNRNFADGEVSADYQRRVLGIYKKLMEKQSGNWYLNNSYFDTLENFARKANGEQEYVNEYDLFFNKLFANGNEIEVLNDLFSNEKNSLYGYSDWISFKNNYAQMSNQGAWFVVEKSSSPESIKKAIKWSESSLRIDKNSPYYLDTLAQLYYKNGEKQKAISTQEQAVKQANEIDETTRQEMEIVLEKMKNGTY